jgi:hypothetical protein
MRISIAIDMKRLNLYMKYMKMHQKCIDGWKRTAIFIKKLIKEAEIIIKI